MRKLNDAVQAALDQTVALRSKHAPGTREYTMVSAAAAALASVFHMIEVVQLQHETNKEAARRDALDALKLATSIVSDVQGWTDSTRNKE